jgi:hypothetical protein
MKRFAADKGVLGTVPSPWAREHIALSSELEQLCGFGRSFEAPPGLLEIAANTACNTICSDVGLHFLVLLDKLGVTLAGGALRDCVRGNIINKVIKYKDLDFFAGSDYNYYTCRQVLRELFPQLAGPSSAGVPPSHDAWRLRAIVASVGAVLRCICPEKPWAYISTSSVITFVNTTSFSVQIIFVAGSTATVHEAFDTDPCRLQLAFDGVSPSIVGTREAWASMETGLVTFATNRGKPVLLSRLRRLEANQGQYTVTDTMKRSADQATPANSCHDVRFCGDVTAFRKQVLRTNQQSTCGLVEELCSFESLLRCFEANSDSLRLIFALFVYY